MSWSRASGSDEDEYDGDVGIATILAREGQDTRPLWERILEREDDRCVGGRQMIGVSQLSVLRSGNLACSLVVLTFRHNRFA